MPTAICTLDLHHSSSRPPDNVNIEQIEAVDGKDRIATLLERVAELGRDADPFMLHLHAALAEKERSYLRSWLHRSRAVVT
jgi:hypothetical protein